MPIGKTLSEFYLLLSWISGPCARNRQALIATVKETQHIATKHKTHILHSGNSSSVRLHRPMGDMETGIYHRHVVLFCRVLFNQNKFINFHDKGFNTQSNARIQSRQSTQYNAIWHIAMDSFPLTIYFTHQVSLCGDGHENKVITDAHLLTLRTLLAGRMDRPPAGFTLTVFLQTDVKGQFVVGRRGGEAG